MTLSADAADSAHEASEARRAQTAAMRILLERLDLAALAAAPASEARAEVLRFTVDSLDRQSRGLTPETRHAVASAVCDEILGLGPLERLLAAPGVTDIMINGLGGVYIEAAGAMSAQPSPFASRDHLMTICQRAAAQAGRRVDEAAPLCDAMLPDGSRINIVWPPLAPDGPLLTIRKLRDQPFTLAALDELGALPGRSAAMLRAAVAARANILITGGGGSGKTTLLNALAGCAGAHERIIACEDAAELRISHPHWVRLEARPANFEGAGEIAMGALIRNALRMRPDRIIVGEVRGAEAFDLVQAMNTGHDGSMGTLHANHPAQALSRLHALAAMGAGRTPSDAMGRLVAGGVDLIAHMERRPGGGRALAHMAALDDDGRVAPIRLDGDAPPRRLLAKTSARGDAAHLRQAFEP
ncbi:MAG: ATPase, T2SS/T4P/T4SS family [Hyphomicrobiales bacterium]|nr:ATPase, T2SS/T4P/T4SS family [Hyphomicrobiales bacterium]